MNATRIVKIASIVMMLSTIGALVLWASIYAAETGSSPVFAQSCPHNTCVSSSCPQCPDPSTWGICLNKPDGSFCPCEITGFHVEMCYDCPWSIGWPYVGVYDDKWYDYVEGGNYCDLQCQSFEMWVCS